MERRQGPDLSRLSGRPRYGSREARPASARPWPARRPRARRARTADRASDLEHARIVAVPGEHGSGAATGPPSFGQLAQLLLARFLLEAHQPPELDHDREVAGRENV